MRILEVAGIGPVPFAGTLLADMGADVLRLDRADTVRRGDAVARPDLDLLGRGRRSAAVDLKHPDGVELVLRLSEGADALLEGFRPGVMERLGLGPELLQARNPALVYGRMTGWGQEGPWAQTAGHDIDYVALSGTLSAIGRYGQPPTPPLNLVGDYGGGALFLAVGVLAALLERQRSGRGQVVDAAMVDGAALLMAPLHGAQQSGFWSEQRGTNLLDSGAPFYDVYACADGEYIAVGAIEPAFYAALLEGLGIEPASLPSQMDRESWPETKQRFAARIAEKSRDDWTRVFEGSDACVAPVLRPDEAARHPQLAARKTFVDVDGVRHPAPAPRFERTPSAIAGPPARAGEHTDEVLADWGIETDEIARLRAADAIA